MDTLSDKALQYRLEQKKLKDEFYNAVKYWLSWPGMTDKDLRSQLESMVTVIDNYIEDRIKEESTQLPSSAA